MNEISSEHNTLHDPIQLYRDVLKPPLASPVPSLPFET